MAVDFTTIVVLLQPSLNVFEPLQVLFKLVLSGSGWIVIIFNTKEEDVILVQFTKIHNLLASGNGDCVRHCGCGVSRCDGTSQCELTSGRERDVRVSCGGC